MHTPGKYYKLLFYKLYKWHYNWHGDGDYPEFTAVCYISLLMILNLATLIFFFDKLVIADVVDTIFPNKFWKLVSSLCIFLFNYFLLYYKRKYTKIITEQEELNKVRRKKENIVVIIYIIITPVMLVLSVVIPYLSK